MSQVFPSTKPQRFVLDRRAAYFATYAERTLQLRTRANAVLASVPLEPAGFGTIVPGSALAYVPEVGQDPEKPNPAFARFFMPAGNARASAPLVFASRA